MNLTGFTITNHVYIPEKLMPDSLFEKKYVELRWEEKRIYGDEEVFHLPLISKEHQHYKEWQQRLQSSKRLVSYLQNKQRTLKILEVGCGNGWLSHQLSKVPDTAIIGADVNFTELQQAGRVFNAIPNLQFIYGDIQSEIFENMQFDIIVFAASIQYFSSLSEIINCCFKLLDARGEIHILDSHFYGRGESIAAKRRTGEYYSRMGFPEMTNHYFHHCISELSAYNYQVLYKPFQWPVFIRPNKNPFIWVCIKKDPC